jgi:L-ribulose-5-phosphate 3-epimerase
MIGKIGCRAHDYGVLTIEQLCEGIQQDGYTTMQLALKKALIEIPDYEVIAQVLKEHNLSVSVLGAYLNYSGLNDERRNENIETLKAQFKTAKILQATMVGTETGSLDDEYRHHEDNTSELAYQRFKEAVIQVLPMAAEQNVFFAVEAVSDHIIRTPKQLHRLVNEVNDPYLKVIFDISNLMTFENFLDQESILNEAFNLLEGFIRVIHVKDFDFVDGKKMIKPLGEGKLKLELLLTLVKQSRYTIDILAEDVERDKLRQTCNYLNESINI